MINCLVIGLGRIGFQLSQDPYREKPCTHTEAILTHPLTHLSGGIDPNPLKRQAFTRKTGAPSYSSWEEYLQKKTKLDILFIASPTNTHEHYLKIAQKHSLPVAVVEKPISKGYREALALKQTFRRSSTRVVVNHERRFADDYHYVKEIIDNKKYGKITSLHAYLYSGHTSLIHSLLHDGTHLLDTAAFLTNPCSRSTDLSITRIKKLQSLSSPGDDHALRFFVIINDVPCYFEVGGNKKYFHFEINLIFERGKIDIGNGIFQEWAAGRSQLYKGFFSLRKKEKRFDRTRYFSNMLKHAVDLYKHPSKPSRSSLEDALIIFKIINGLKLSRFSR